MKLQISGKVVEIKNEESREYNGKTYRTKKFVIEQINEEYPQTFLIEANDDKIELIGNIKLDEILNVHVNLQGRKWLSPKTNENMYFTTFRLWKLERIAQPSAPSAPMESNAQNIPVSEVAEDDLPF